MMVEETEGNDRALALWCVDSVEVDSELLEHLTCLGDVAFEPRFEPFDLMCGHQHNAVLFEINQQTVNCPSIHCVPGGDF